MPFEFPPMPPPQTTPSAYPVVHRKEHVDFSTWRELVLDGKYADEKLLTYLYKQGWESEACKAFMRDCGGYSSKPQLAPYQRRALEIGDVQRKVAAAAWKELVRLLTRNMTGDAKTWALEAQKYYQDISTG